MLLVPMFFGEIADGCDIKRNGFLINKISKLVITARNNPENDVVMLPGVCCMTTEKGKNALIEIGLSKSNFHEVEIMSNKSGVLYFIDVDAKGKGIEIYHGTKIRIDTDKYDILKKSININRSKIKEM